MVSEMVTTAQSLLIGSLPVPSDFPTTEFVSAELEFRARTGTSPVSPAPTWTEFSSAWMAVAYRFLDATYFDEEFRASFSTYGAAPEAPERYRQERHLFGLFVSGLSAIESLCYGVCAIAWEANPKHVSLAKPGQKKGVSPESTRDRLQAHFGGDAITQTLDALIASQPYRDWVDIRNSLAHRTSPGRKHYKHLGSAPAPEPPSEWGDLVLDGNVTADHRLWLRDVLASLLADAGRFASGHF